MVISKIRQYLKEHNLYHEVHRKGCSGLVFEINIEDGDWKHDHGYCDYLMGELGYKCIKEEVTDEHGDDWYSSVHTYVDEKVVALFSSK